jgi:site-specific recombinase XerD
MLEKYFSAPKTLRRLRLGLSGPYIDGFASALAADGYSPSTAVHYLRIAAHLGRYVQEQRATFAALTPSTLVAFRRHLPRCHCPFANGGRTDHHPRFGGQRFYTYLVQRGVCAAPASQRDSQGEPELVGTFRTWFRTHRGASDSTLRLYSRDARALCETLGPDPQQWTTGQLRQFILARAARRKTETTQKLLTSLRAFLRYLYVCGVCPTDLAPAIPAVAHWRLASMPRTLTAEEVARLLTTCQGEKLRQRRDRAMLLLLIRLGLRAGDVARLRLGDIEWTTGTLRVIGKGRYEVRLPLPQEVGDALLQYLAGSTQHRSTDHVFLRNRAPFRPLVRGDGVSSVVRRALQRAGIVSPHKGAHLLRHTAATEMLRHGVPLSQIGLVLRHRSLDMTAYYAKVDVATLQMVSQPWPEVHA